jgi:CheY-like chemotaxis protein
MHTVEAHHSLALIESLALILPRLRLHGRDGRELARELRTSATAIPRALAASALAARPHVAARDRPRAHALARHVHALLFTGHAWHYEMPGLRSRALVQAEHLAEYLTPAA